MRSAFFICLLFCMTSHAQYFKHTYGWGPFNTAPSMCQTPDGGFAMLGSFSSTGSGQTDFVVIRTDSSGTFQWAHAYGSWGIESAACILTLPDSGFLLCGYSNSYSGNLGYDGLVVRLNATGDTLWQRSIGSTDWDFIHDAKLLDDGNYLLTGSTNSTSNGLSAGWLVVMDPTGNILRQKVLETNANIFLNSSSISATGFVLSAGSIQSTDSLIHQPIIIKTEFATLDTVLTFQLPDHPEGEFASIVGQSNGDIVACGYSITAGRTDQDQLIVSIDSSGIFQWKSGGLTTGEEYFNKVIRSGDTLYCVGSTNSYGGGKLDFQLNIYDPNGVRLEGPTFGDLQDEVGKDVLLTSNRRILLFGTTTTFGPGLQSMLLISTDSSFQTGGAFVIGVNEPTNRQEVNIFPNPTNGPLKVIHSNANSTKKINWKLISLDGRIVNQGNEWTVELNLDLSTVPNGVYLFFLEENGVQLRRKIVVQHD